MLTLCAPLPGGTKNPRRDRRRNLRTVAPAGSRKTWHGGAPAPPDSSPTSPPARSSTSPRGSNALAGDLACASLTTRGVDPASAKHSLTTSEAWKAWANSSVASVVALALEEWLVQALGG